MSTFAVRVERIRSVEAHPNADRLDLIQVLDWRCVTAKGNFKEGDLCVYFPIDSLLPDAVEAFIFEPDSKIKLDKHRVKTIKLRGAISQGLCVGADSLAVYLGRAERFGEGEDLTKALGVVKYEPPAPPAQMAGGLMVSKRNLNPHFEKYTDLENAKNYPGIFVDGEDVIATEKIHGTNFRAGYVETTANTFFKKVLKFFRLLPKHEFVYGSRNVQLQSKPKTHKTWYESVEQIEQNVYAEIVEKYELRKRILPGFVIYGEIYGDGIQKNYTYGCDSGEHKLAVFDIMIHGRYSSYSDFMAKALGLPTVPILYRGPFNVATLKALTIGDSVLVPSQKVREGVVVKPTIETTHPQLGRKILKFISDEYLLKDNTDFH